MQSLVTNELNWMIGGAQGSGVDSSANIFSRANALAGLWVYGTREYYSNIKGLHSYFEVRISAEPIQCKVDNVNVLATFDAETLVRHSDVVEPGGVILHDAAALGTPVEKIDTIEKELRGKIQSRLQRQGLGADVAGVLEEARRRGIRIYAVPYGDLIDQTGKRMGGAQATSLARTLNVLATSVSCALLGFDRNLLYQAIRETFAAKKKLVDMNVVGAGVAYDYVLNNFKEGIPYRITPIENKERMLIVGNEAVALGKMVGGCRMQTYYPITPASDESEFLEAHEYFDLLDGHGKDSILVVQTEDEIAAITMAIGAALTGARVATSTSGPGFSLMVEGMGWAGMNEVPVVITNYSRGGPSTGMPTRTEQGDLKFALSASHGESPRIILCSGDIEESFYDAIRALNYAERYQLPVIHLVDKGLANSRITLSPPDPRLLNLERGKLIEAGRQPDGEYKRFAFTEDGVSPRAVLGMAGYRFWNTGDEHSEIGHINEEPENRVKMMNKRMTKLETADREIPTSEKVNFFPAKGRADLTIVGWGSSKGAILEGMRLLERDGVRVEFLQIRLASPFPTRLVKERLSEAKFAIDIEQNYSAQMAAVIREKTGIDIENRILKYNGRPISRDEIRQSVRQVLARPQENRRVVLTHGA